MQKLLSTTALTVVLAVSVIGSASAAPLSLTGVTGTVWSYNNPSPGNINTPQEQALPNAYVGGQNLQSSSFGFSGTGTLSFFLPLNASNPTISTFLASSGATVTGLASGTGNRFVSTTNFDLTSLFEFTFTTTATITGTITHDDGVSLFNAAAPGTNLLPSGASFPSPASTTAYSIGPGTYNLFYSEANGLPAQLNFDIATSSVPEPATLALLGTGLIGAGLAGRRRKRGGTSTSA